MVWSIEIKIPGYLETLKKNHNKNELEASLTGDTIEQSDSGMKNDPAFLQEAEVANDDADLTSDASKIN